MWSAQAESVLREERNPAWISRGEKARKAREATSIDTCLLAGYTVVLASARLHWEWVVMAVGVDLAKATDAELVQMQLHANDWYVRHARRMLAERGAKPEVQAALQKMLRENPDETRKLRALWALHGVGGLDEATALETLKSPLEYLRAWVIQLRCEDGTPTAAELVEFAKMARADASPVVRLYLASAAQRLPIPQRWPILEGLASHAEDATDHNLPLLLWYAAEPAVAADPVKAAELLANCKIPKVQEFIARRMAAK